MIGALDLLSINIYEIDSVCPAVVDIQNSLSTFPNLPPNHECVVRIAKQVDILKSKNANDVLTEEEVKELKLDLETSF